MHDHHQVGRALVDGDADVAHVGRQARLRDRDAVLHLHLRDIEIGAELEGDGDREAAVAGRVRRHVEHVLDAVDLLLDRRDHGRGDDLGAGAGILPGDVDRSAARFPDIARPAGAKNATPPRITNTIETHGGEDRPVDEEMRYAHARAARTLTVAAACRLRRRGRRRALLLRRAPWCRARARIRPLTMTRSSAPMPSLMTRRLSDVSCPSVTYFDARGVLVVDHETNLRACSVPMATSGTSSAS